MIALFYTLTIFLIFSIVGYAIYSFLPKNSPPSHIFIVPTFGFSFILLLVFFGSRLNFPVAYFSTELTFSLLFISSIVIFFKKLSFSIKKLYPFLILIFVSMMLTSSPMLSFGFDWISYGNDDMANYTMSADRFISNGWYVEPTEKLILGQDYNSSFYFMHAVNFQRAGAELLIAWAASLFSLTAHEVFMPLIMAINLALLFVVGGLALNLKTSHKTVIVVMFLLTINPLHNLGALYQLIGQVGGLSILIALSIMMFKSFENIVSYKSLLAQALLLSSLLIWYPEVLTLLGAAGLIYLILNYKQVKKHKFRYVSNASLVALIAILILNIYVYEMFVFLFFQIFRVLSDLDIDLNQLALLESSANFYSTNSKIYIQQLIDMNSNFYIFPWFLIPIGIPTFFGMVPISYSTIFPYDNLIIFGGIVILFWLSLKVTPYNLKEYNSSPNNSFFLLMLILGLLFFLTRTDFTLFKTGLYMQPFLTVMIGSYVCSNTFSFTNFINNRFALAFLIFITVSIMATWFEYVEKSRGDSRGGLIEISGGSSQKILKQFSSLIDSAPRSKLKENNTVIISDTTNIVLGKLQPTYAKDISLFFPARDFFGNIQATNYYNEASMKLNKDLTMYKTYPIHKNAFAKINPVLLEGKEKFYITTAFKTDIFNGIVKSNFSKDNYFINFLPENHLQWISSALGPAYYSGARGMASFFQLEPDYFYPDDSFSSLGRHLLFLINNPAKNSRLHLNITASVLKQHNHKLPPNISIIGDNIIQPKIIGRGSARVYSEVLHPTYIDNDAYVSIDLGRDGALFNEKKRFLAKLFNADVPNDSRLPVLYGRDISLVSEAFYHKLDKNRPSNVKNFPKDLKNIYLEYSGVYEDGWLSDEFYFILNKKDSHKSLQFRGFIPLIENENHITKFIVFVNDKKVLSKEFGVGYFDINLKNQFMNGANKIHVKFYSSQKLPEGDDRVTGAYLNFLGFND